MIKNPLQNAEALETVAVVLLGIILLCTLEPVSSLRLALAGILAGLLIVLTGVSVWQQRHRHQ